MPYVIRKGRADDVSFLGEITLLGSRGAIGWGVYDALLGGTDDYLLSKLAGLASTKAVSFHHFSQRLIAEVDGQPAASLTGFTSSFEAREKRIAASVEVFSPAELSRMDEARPAIATCSIYSEPGTMVIENVGTLPQFRRMGLQDALLKAVLAWGRETGHKRAGISVLVGNEPAERAYVKIGFQLIEEKRHAAFEQVMRSPGMRYLEMPL